MRLTAEQLRRRARALAKLQQARLFDDVEYLKFKEERERLTRLGKLPPPRR